MGPEYLNQVVLQGRWHGYGRPELGPSSSPSGNRRRLSRIDPARIIIGGASAGGGLTAALALLARDRGKVSPLLLFQLLVYP